MGLKSLNDYTNIKNKMIIQEKDDEIERLRKQIIELISYN